MDRSQRNGTLGRRGWLILTAWALLMLAGVAIAMVTNQVDLRAYRAGADAWMANEAEMYTGALVYEGFELPFAYPPVAAVLFVPFAAVPLPVAAALLALLSLAALTLTGLVAARAEVGPGRRALLLGLGTAAVAMVVEPVWSTLPAGQINLVLMGLIVADCLLPKTKWPRGLLIGIAAAIKLTPLIFLLYFVVRRQWRPVATALGTFAVATAIGFAVAPKGSMHYWFGGGLFDDRRVGHDWWPMNQSIRGVLARMGIEGTVELVAWVVLSLVVIGVAWLGARRARQAGDDLLALVLIAVAGLFASPLSWTHHWVWAVPGLILLLRAVRRPRSVLRVVLAVVAMLAFVTGLPLMMTEGGDAAPALSPVQRIFAETYILIGLVLLALGLYRRKSTEDEGTPAEVATPEPAAKTEPASKTDPASKTEPAEPEAKPEPAAAPLA